MNHIITLHTSLYLIFAFSVYVDLADQYKIMDAASDVPRRNLVAQHLREVIDIIEQKVSKKCYAP